MTGRVMLISGGPSSIIRLLSERYGCDKPEIVNFEEKEITRPRSTLRLLRKPPTDLVVFATKQLGLQRFQFALAFYLLLARADQRLILDHAGQTVRVTWPRFVTLQFPRFIAEVLASAIVLVLTTVRLVGLSLRFRSPKVQ